MESLRKKTPLPHRIIHLPVTSISDSNQSKYIGEFVTNAVEVRDETQAESLYNSGCFGDSPHQTKAKSIGHYVIDDGRVLHVESDSKISTLMLVEAFFLHYTLKCLQIRHLDVVLPTKDVLNRFTKAEPDFVTHFVAYHYFRSKNWVVRSGVKFGCDFLLYNIGPKYYHAKYMVLVRKAGSQQGPKFPSKEVLAWYRIGETSGKICILCEVHYPEMTDTWELVESLNKFKVNCISLKRLI